MQLVDRYPDGVFCWADIGSTDAEGAKAFYSELFGWSGVDVPTDQGIPYTMMQIDGHNVCGLSQLSPEMMAQGVPSAWTSYVKHDDVDSVAAKAAEAGGNVMFPPFDAMESGRMTILGDPAGSFLGVWQPKQHKGADVVNAPNTMVWNELQTREPEASARFYNETFGWEPRTDENGYVSFLQDGRMHAGMIPIDDSFGDVPNHWGVYFLVEDVESAAARVTELGGTVLMPPTPAGKIGKFSVVHDPQGGIFSIIQFFGPADAPPSV